jgi:hypothetical protein
MSVYGREWISDCGPGAAPAYSVCHWAEYFMNYNNDIGDYMEWSGEGWYPVNFSNDAYKFATNYVMYGLTH